MAIAKKLHYCWFGGKDFSAREERCMRSWRALCPDYEIVRWDESNSPLGDNDYVRQAYEMGKWAFVSDYVRLYALKEQGGIYLDTDVELVRPLDEFCSHSAVLGFESRERVATCLMGGEAGHPFFTRAMELYAARQFKRPDGGWDDTTNVKLLTDLLVQLGLRQDGSRQCVDGVEIYPGEYFSPKSLETGKISRTERTCAIHHFQASWMTPAQRRNTRLAQWLGPKWTAIIKQKLGRC